MNSKTKFVILLLLALTIIFGATVLLANVFIHGKIIVAVLLIVLMIPLVGTLSVIIRKSYYDLKAGMPSDDERTIKVRMYAAGYAYFISLYVWIVLLAFHRYLESDDLLMIGLAAMAISFGASWIIVNRKKDLV